MSRALIRSNRRAPSSFFLAGPAFDQEQLLCVKQVGENIFVVRFQNASNSASAFVFRFVFEFHTYTDYTERAISSIVVSPFRACARPSS